MIRVYRFPCEPASAADAAELHRQLRLAGDYRRALAWAENGERDAVAALYLESPKVRAVQEKIDATEDEAARAELWPALRAAQAAHRKTDAYREGVRQIRERRGPMTRALRGAISARGLYWGTYLLVEDAHDRAARDLPPWERLRVRGSWDSIGVQVQSTKLLTGDRLVGGEDTRVRLSADLYALGDRVDHYATIAPAGHRGKAGHVRPASHRTLSIRTGSDGRAPVWTRCHVRTEAGRSHGVNGTGPRPVPADAKISWAKVVRVETTHRAVVTPTGPRMIARERWELQIVADHDEARSAPTGQGTVGVDLGWRRVDGGIRVAYATRPGGFSQCVIPDRVLDMRSRADAIRGHRDDHMNVARAAILRVRETAPDWFRAATEATHAWRKIGRFVSLARQLAAQPGDLLWLAVGLCAWLDKDRHLREFEAGLRRRQRLTVDGITRQWIADVLRGCDVLAIGNPPPAAKAKSRATAPSEQVRRAAVAHSEVATAAARIKLVQMAKSRGLRVVEVDSEGFSRICPDCGADRGPSIEVVATCPVCGASEDQDRTASRSIALASARVLAGDVLAPAIAKASAKPKAPRRTRKAAKAAPLAVDSSTAGVDS